MIGVVMAMCLMMRRTWRTRRDEEVDGGDGLSKSALALRWVCKTVSRPVGSVGVSRGRKARRLASAVHLLGWMDSKISFIFETSLPSCFIKPIRSS